MEQGNKICLLGNIKDPPVLVAVILKMTGQCFCLSPVILSFMDASEKEAEGWI